MTTRAGIQSLNRALSGLVTAIGTQTELFCGTICRRDHKTDALSQQAW